jgi:AGZA family xanthine/uracil permease-like MFS transporter
MFDRLFALRRNGTSIQTETIAGITSFLAMSYIIFVNPIILSSTGMDKAAVIVVTCLASAIGCFFMAFWANWPIGLAPGMGLNAFFAYTVVQSMGWSWQSALGAVFVSGCIFVFLTATGLRSLIVKAIPPVMQVAVPAGVGLFLALIALKNAGAVVTSQNTLLRLGDMHSLPVVLFVIGFFLILALEQLKIKGSILISILVVTALGVAFDDKIALPSTYFSLPPSISPIFLQLDISTALSHGIFNVIIIIVLVEIFDATGVLTGVARKAGLLAKPESINRPLAADSAAIVCSSLLGTSSTTAYAESIAGIHAGGRTGMTALVIGVLFLFAMFFVPVIGIVPDYAVAPALFYVAGLMLSELSHVDWEDLTQATPAALTVISIPFTFSIANGLAFGFISYSFVMLLAGKYRQVHPAVWVISALLLSKFVFFDDH